MKVHIDWQRESEPPDYILDQLIVRLGGGTAVKAMVDDGLEVWLVFGFRHSERPVPWTALTCKGYTLIDGEWIDTLNYKSREFNAGDPTPPDMNQELNALAALPIAYLHREVRRRETKPG